MDAAKKVSPPDTLVLARRYLHGRLCVGSPGWLAALKAGKDLPRMIVDLRIYTTRPGKLAAFVKLYRDHAWELQQKYLGDCIGWYTTVEGTLNQVVHLWRYESQADREARRAAMGADPAWGDYLRVSEEAGLLLAQENRILRPTDFFLGS